MIKAVKHNSLFNDVAAMLQERGPRFCSQHLEQLFQACFFCDYQTVLVGGAKEPLYAPAVGTQPASIHYTRDYYRSALHEVAHWCIAGENRRKQEDYGYWYAPEGRTLEQQARFEQVEVRPQAIELLFCAAVGHDFYVSCDNFITTGNDEAFAHAVWHEAMRMLEKGAPPRAQQWLSVLHLAYRQPKVSARQIAHVWRHNVPGGLL